MTPMGAPHPMGPEYQNGICGCGESCCQTFCCPCLVVEATEAMIDTGTVKQPCDGIGPVRLSFFILSMFGCNSCYSTFVTRKKLRQKHGMNENVPLDCISHCCFPHCAIARLQRGQTAHHDVSQPQIIMRCRCLPNSRCRWSQGPIVIRARRHVDA